MEKTANDRRESLDSPINTQDAKGNKEARSLTNDENADTDPNEIAEKASFSDNRKKNTEEKGRFDGTIGI